MTLGRGSSASRGTAARVALAVMDELGCVHPEAAPAMRLLQRAGMYWIGEIDPFDAGPFIGAARSQIFPIVETRRGTLDAEALEPAPDAKLCIVSTEEGDGFRATATPAQVDGDVVRLPKEASDRLDIEPGAEVAVTPMPQRSEDTGERRRG